HRRRGGAQVNAQRAQFRGDEPLPARAASVARIDPRPGELRVVDKSRGFEFRYRFVDQRPIESPYHQSPAHLTLAVGPPRKHRGRNLHRRAASVERDNRLDVQSIELSADAQPMRPRDRTRDIKTQVTIDAHFDAAASLMLAFDRG